MAQNGNEIDSEIDHAQRKVQLARAELAQDIEAVSRTSRNALRSTLHQAVHAAKPVVLAGAALVGTIVVVRIVRGTVRLLSHSPKRHEHRQQSPSILRSILRSALMSAGTAIASTVARNLAQAHVERTLKTQSTRRLPMPAPARERFS